MNEPWIVRKKNIKKLWVILILILTLTVLLQILIPIKGHFEVEEWFAFGAWFGFFSCIIMIIFAKILGFFIKRKDDYYEK